QAQLKVLMTAPPMSAEKHAQVMRKRNLDRRTIEAEKEMRQATFSLFDKLA
ncbi:MAG: hypothetical protein RL748_1171, partial [Pseudomonadota bacterium]